MILDAVPEELLPSNEYICGVDKLTAKALIFKGVDTVHAKAVSLAITCNVKPVKVVYNNLSITYYKTIFDPGITASSYS